MKTAGMVLLIFFSTLIGIIASFRVKNETEDLKDLITFMAFIKERISFFNSPLNEIYSSYTTQNQRIQSFVDDVAFGGWTYTLQNNDTVYLDKDTKKLINEFGNKLGKTGKDELLPHIEYYITAVTKKLDCMKEEAPQKIKLRIALGVCSGIMAVILLL